MLHCHDILRLYYTIFSISIVPPVIVKMATLEVERRAAQCTSCLVQSSISRPRTIWMRYMRMIKRPMRKWGVRQRDSGPLINLETRYVVMIARVIQVPAVRWSGYSYRCPLSRYTNTVPEK